MTPTLRPRAEPLEARAVVAERDVARRLAIRLLALGEIAQRRLRLVIAEDTLVVLGASDELPWVDGVQYLGAEPSSPSMLIPTTRETSPSSVLIERALRRVNHLPDGPFALTSFERVMPLRHAVPVTRAALARWVNSP